MFGFDRPVARLGDIATCPECNKGSGKIIEGCKQMVVDGIPVALDGYIIACGCTIGRNRIIAKSSHIFADDGRPRSNFSPPNTISEFDNFSKDQKILQRKQIRADKNRLIETSEKLGDNLLHFAQTKQEFKEEISTFAANIADKVENGIISYTDGATQIKEKEKSLFDESMRWSQRGISILAGTSQIIGGAQGCKHWASCLIYSVPSFAHGANNIYEGFFDEVGLVRKGYRGLAELLGYEAVHGDIAYNVVDLGLSMYSVLKYAPAINELGNKKLTLWYHNHQDMIRAYKKMSKVALSFEIFSDTFTLGTLTDNIRNAFIMDKKTEETALILKDPEQIKNAKDMLDCSIIVINENKFYYCEIAK
ncbi:DUF4225 domain-containing protein [Orbaceae bacterium ac157xtp]